jgi:hypothetical protein
VSAATGYFDKLIRSGFESPAPLMGSVPCQQGNEELPSPEAREGEPAHSLPAELLPRSIGFRAACLTLEAEKTCGEPART